MRLRITGAVWLRGGGGPLNREQHGGAGLPAVYPNEVQHDLSVENRHYSEQVHCCGICPITACLEVLNIAFCSPKEFWSESMI
ncbi:hypothetical protein CB1_000165014 [Camelus ferus]|nr:hypothetical protein CB1_000165014 [Camelus ferus]